MSETMKNVMDKYPEIEPGYNIPDPTELPPPGQIECDMCGNWYSEDHMNIVDDSSDNDRDVCNSCYWNSGF